MQKKDKKKEADYYSASLGKQQSCLSVLLLLALFLGNFLSRYFFLSDWFLGCFLDCFLNCHDTTSFG